MVPLANGEWKDVHDYRQQSSSASYLPDVRVPLLCLNAEDDPVVRPISWPLDVSLFIYIVSKLFSFVTTLPILLTIHPTGRSKESINNLCIYKNRRAPWMECWFKPFSAQLGWRCVSCILWGSTASTEGTSATAQPTIWVFQQPYPKQALVKWNKCGCVT